jgi:uncharacterized membrane protein (UPF0127 family)
MIRLFAERDIARGGASRPVFLRGDQVPKWVEVRNQSRGRAPVVRARWCSSFGCKLRGLSLRRSIPPGTGLLLVEGRAGRWATAIHMFGMLFPLGVVWLDGKGKVVDMRRAEPWRVYIPKAAARFTLEALPETLDSVAVGDVLEIGDAVA